MSVHVLLVDDDESVRFAVKETLLLDGFRVDVLDRGRPAVGLIDHLTPDVVVLDVTLPDITGVALARILRHRWPMLPIVFATGHGVEMLREFRGVPRTAIVQKPYAIAELEDLLMQLSRARAS